MHGDQLALQMRRQLADHQRVPVERRLDVVAIGAAFRRLREVEEAPVPARDLDSFISEPRRPAGDVIQRVERRFVAGELCEEDRGALDCFHQLSPWTAVPSEFYQGNILRQAAAKLRAHKRATYCTVRKPLR
jgi:hypothetical protein